MTQTVLWTKKFKNLAALFSYVDSLPNQSLSGSVSYDAKWSATGRSIKVRCIRHIDDAPDDRFAGRGMVG